jgi:hypothetical protein
MEVGKGQQAQARMNHTGAHDLLAFRESAGKIRGWSDRVRHRFQN